MDTFFQRQQQSAELMLTLVGTRFPEIEGSELHLTTIIQVGSIGVAVFKAEWNHREIIVKASLVPFLFSEPIITKMCLQSGAPRFPTFLFNVQHPVSGSSEMIQLFGMELICGSTLSMDRTRPIEWIAHQMFDVLEDLHVNRKLSHLDLSMSNWIVRSDGLSLIDFGLAFPGAKTITGHCGTKLYASLTIHSTSDLVATEISEDDEDSSFLDGGCTVGYFSDLESAMYVLQHCYGELGWSESDTWDEIRVKKQSFKIEDCAHPIIAALLTYVRSDPTRSAVSVPDYSYLRSLI